MIHGLQQLIEAHVAEAVREQLAHHVAQIDQQQEADKWNRILTSIMERKHESKRDS